MHPNTYSWALSWAMAVAALCSLANPTPARAEKTADLDTALETLLTAGPGDSGQTQLQTAWQKIASSDSAAIVPILEAMPNSNPLAQNWLRSTVDTIAERTLQTGGQLPTAELKQFLLDPSHSPRARWVAYEWLNEVAPGPTAELLSQLLNDSSLAIRFEAVSQWMDKAETTEDSSVKINTYRTAIAAARDKQQIDQCVDALQKLGETVDPNSLLGFIESWQVVGPFSNTERKGFATSYPPEHAVDLTATYAGKEGEVTWLPPTIATDYGNVNLNKVIDKHMGAVAYAWVSILSPISQAVECRWMTPNASKLWVNGKLVAEHEIYHAAADPFDQYKAPAELRQGSNTIMLKVCQNEQTESWAQDWEFQFRLTDNLGGPLPDVTTNLQVNP
jgi:hypothetical protein